MSLGEDAQPNPLGVDLGSRPGVNSTLEEVFREHYGRLVAILTRLAEDRSQAEEWVADAFWKLSACPTLFRPDGNLAGWLYRTAVNLGLDMLRANFRRRRKEQAAGETAIRNRQVADALGEVLREEKRKQVRTVLAKLKPAQAQLLLLRIDGLSYKELSGLLSLSPGSIGTLLARAEAAFEKKYRALYGGEE